MVGCLVHSCYLHKDFLSVSSVIWQRFFQRDSRLCRRWGSHAWRVAIGKTKSQAFWRYVLLMLDSSLLRNIMVKCFLWGSENSAFLSFTSIKMFSNGNLQSFHEIVQMAFMKWTILIEKRCSWFQLILISLHFFLNLNLWSNP